MCISATEAKPDSTGPGAPDRTGIEHTHQSLFSHPNPQTFDIFLASSFNQKEALNELLDSTP
jgi:hypothetical protein